MPYESEIDILEILKNKNKVTQREISSETGISLGMVNYLIKKFVKKGFVKIERLNSKNLRYILTPKGMREKAKKTLKYMRSSYRAINDVKRKIINISQRVKNKGNDLYLINDSSEIYELVSSILEEEDRKYFTENSIEQVNGKDCSIVYWKHDIEEVRNKFAGVEFVDLLG